MSVQAWQVTSLGEPRDALRTLARLGLASPTPPNGRCGLVPDWTTLWLTTELPDVVWRMKYSVASASLENTYSASGLSRAAMYSTTSSRVRYGTTAIIGPKISSFISRMSSFTWVTTVGAM